MTLLQGLLSQAWRRVPQDATIRQGAGPRVRMWGDYFMGELYCIMRAIHNDYFIIDSDIKYFYRLDHPLLENYAVGDTVIVTAKPMKLLDDFSLATYYVQPNFPSCNE